MSPTLAYSRLPSPLFLMVLEKTTVLFTAYQGKIKSFERSSISPAPALYKIAIASFPHSFQKDDGTLHSILRSFQRHKKNITPPITACMI